MGQDAPKNIIVSDFEPVTLRDKNPLDAINALFSFSSGEAKNVAGWYQAAKNRKATASRALRFLAIAFFVIGGLAPIIAGFWHGDQTANQMVEINQAGYLLIGLAAGFLAFDRYFGMSSGWIRYMTSLAAVERLRSEFMFDWTVMLKKAPTSLDDATIVAFLDRAQTFHKGLLELVEKETAAWVAEFQSSIADLDKAVQAQRQAAEANVQAALKQEADVRERVKREEQAAAADRQPGAVNLEVEGDSDAPIEILLDGSKVRETTARTTGLLNLAKGPHSVEVRGMKGGKSISASKIVNIEPGKTADLKLALR